VWKKFHRGQIHDSLRDLIPDVANKLLGRGPKADELDEGDFWAIRDLSFDVGPGQTLGIIGANGSGKSTTLKILTRILAPTRGRTQVTGRAGALIEVAAGFHGDLSGRENVFLQGAIMGMRNADTVKKFDQIVEFAGVADAIDTPVKRYSSGMSARLGFSIAAHLEPDVLIIDEVLAVGDMQFQERAFGRIRELARSGIPVVLVSHQLDRVAELCSEAILLDKGETAWRGTADEAIAAYLRRTDQTHVTPTGLIEFESTQLVPGDVFETGTQCSVIISGVLKEPLPPTVDPLVVRIRSLRTAQTMHLLGSRTIGLTHIEAGRFAVRLDFMANFQPATYSIEITSRDNANERDIARAPSALFRVTASRYWFGPVQVNPVIRQAKEPGELV
jgi:ABC-type polysaccharide/polyol phosphate transport system ATPase subunit